jgi:hypothetical protein
VANIRRRQPRDGAAQSEWLLPLQTPVRRTGPIRIAALPKRSATACAPVTVRHRSPTVTFTANPKELPSRQVVVLGLGGGGTACQRRLGLARPTRRAQPSTGAAKSRRSDDAGSDVRGILWRLPGPAACPRAGRRRPGVAGRAGRDPSGMRGRSAVGPLEFAGRPVLSAQRTAPLPGDARPVVPVSVTFGDNIMRGTAYLGRSTLSHGGRVAPAALRRGPLL